MARSRTLPTGLILTLLVISLALLFALARPAAAEQPPETKAGETFVVVQLKPGAAAGDLADALSSRGAAFEKNVGKGGVIRVKLPRGGDASALLAALRGDPAVGAAGFDLTVRAFDIPNDPAYSRQWHLQPGQGGIDAPGAWDLSPARGAGVTVAVIDTGVAYENYSGGQALFAPKVFAPAPDLAGVPIVAPWDWIDGDSHAGDEHGHGTHVSGTILQDTDNGLSGAGVSAANLMPLRILDFSGNGSGTDLIDAIYYAADHGAKVINLSLGFSGTGLPDASGNYCSEIIGLPGALDYAYAMGVTVVAASGNDGAANVACPAAYPTVIAVGSVGYNGAVTYYSNRGDQLDVAAPGGDPEADLNGDGEADQVVQQSYCLDPFLLYVTGGYNTFCDMPMSGTSMASPHVAGTAAMLKAQHSTLSPDQVRTLLQSTARDGGAPGTDNEYGHGVIDARAALADVIANPPPLPPPGPPPNPRPAPQPGATNVVATAISATSVRVTWNDAATNETGFRVDRSTDGGGSWVQAGSVQANVVTFTNYSLTPGTSYMFRVRSYDDFGNSAWSNLAAATTLSPPGAPTGVTATPLSGTTVRLNWTDTATSESGFKVERSTDGTNFSVVTYAARDATTATAGSLIPSTAYSFRVRAYDGGVDGPPSTMVSATTFALPSAPANLTATSLGASSVRLAWTDTSTTEQGFRIDASSDGGVTWAQANQIPANFVSWTVSNLTPSTSYAFRVKGYDGTLNGAPSNTALTSTAAVPGAPSNLTASAPNSTSIRLDWGDTNSTEQGFRVERSPDGAVWTQVAQLSANAVTWTNSNLAPATTFSYRVRAFDGTLNGPFSNVATATTSGAPSAPGGLTATALSTAAIRLNWVDMSSNESGFKIERSLDGATWTQIAFAGANSTTYSVTGLAPETSYQFRLRAYEGTINGEYSATVATATFPPPAAPSGLAVTTLSTNSLRLDWTNVSPYQTGLRLERSSDGVSWTTTQLSATTTTYTFFGLTPGASFQFRIRAVDGATNGPNSETVVGGPFAPPAAPGEVQATVLSASSIRLTWTDLCGYESGYRVERSTDGVTWALVGFLAADTTTFTNNGLTHGVTYQYRVRAIAGATNGAYSAVVSVTP